MEFIKNALGRMVPAEINGRKVKPYAGAFNDAASGGRKAAPLIPRCFPGRVNKVIGSIDEVLDRLPLKNGMCISFHHHLRNGDFVVNMVVDRLARRGIRDIVLAPSALFPTHDKLIPHIESGVISRIEGSMNGEVGRACSMGKMKGTATLRSHGGRVRAIQDGDLHVDVAFIAAPAADCFGNANGVLGKSACGPLAYSDIDSQYADNVVVITDNLVPYPCVPWSIKGGYVNYVVTVDSIGDPSKIVSGTTRLTKSPTQLLIADLAAKFVEDAGLIREGMSFQAGAGGISLAFNVCLADRMKKKGVTASFAHGGSNEILVKMLENGQLKYICDAQSFDLEGVRSLRENPNHVESPLWVSYNYHAKGCLSHMLDVGVLGATEIDLNFNVNVNTHSDGLLLHGTGGFPDVAAGSAVTIITAPSFRKRIPIIRESVTTVTCPGELVDVIVTERGICINPRRQDLIELTKNSKLPIKPIHQLMEEVYAITGVPDKVEFDDRVVAVIEWRDGTVIDSVRKIK